ncbi:MAG: HD domain-containing protein [Methanoregula sp.]|nr:HD domain-containing protein [Methanoregula sp.]
MMIPIMNDMIRYFHNDVRRINHALKVYDFARLIAHESGIDKETRLVIKIAALLHDIGIKEAERKYHSSASRYQEEEGPAVARTILEQYHLDEKLVDRVCYIIGNHHTYTKIDGIDFQILVEADFIVNIYEDEMKPEVIQSIKKKIFKTEAGTRLLEGMYL